MHAASLNSRRGIAALLAVAGLSLMGGCGLFSEPGLVVHVVGEEGSRDIAVVQTDGSEVRTALAAGGDDFGPVWSPNRQSIAYLSDRDGNVELYVVRADGGVVTRATDTGVPESQPTWSPEGDRLAYTSPDADGKPQIYWLRLSDLIPHRLQFRSESEVDPAWSPKGVWIAFASLDADGNSLGLSLRNPDGVDELRISESRDRSPTWSPDGKKLAFVRSTVIAGSEQEGTEEIDQEIYVLDVDERGPVGQARKLTDHPGQDFAPRWSPDGKRIVFLSDRHESLDILTVSDRGEDLRELTRNDIPEVAVRWGSDGRIVFESQPAGRSVLFIMNADGTQQQLIAGVLPRSQPDW